MEKSTRYKKSYSLKAILLSIIILIILVGFFVFNILTTDNILTVVVFSFCLLFMFFGLMGEIIGASKGKLQLIKTEKYIKKTNPYMYYRELPNNFGIGVTSLLIDSKLENYKDIVAVILDLCARGYLTLVKENDKYVITILKNSDDNLLENEKYVLSLIISGNLKNIDYQEWFNYCLSDGNRLGLFYHKDMKFNTKAPLSEETIKKNRLLHFRISIILSLCISLLILFNSGTFLTAIEYFILIFIIIYIILSVPFYLINIIIGLSNFTRQMSDDNYKNVIENNLIRTKKGVEELHKLYAFRNFINDFGTFAQKSPSEIILWDRYLSYAQVFGLTKNIMKSGYKELVDNSSYKIDDIDNIYIENIEISNFKI